MERNPKTVQTMKIEFDPVEEQNAIALIEKADKDSKDCFTKEWLPSSTSCSQCADNVLCSILVKYRRTQRQKDTSKVYLDEVSYENIPVKRLVKLIKNAYNDDTPYYLVDIEEVIKEYLKTDDPKIVTACSKRFVDENNLNSFFA